MAQAARARAGGYTSGMASPANADRPSAHSSGSSQARSDDAPTEAFGPLTVIRHVKDDGRALLLYTYRHGDDDAGDRPT
jgi:hypothetical protein